MSALTTEEYREIRLQAEAQTRADLARLRAEAQKEWEKDRKADLERRLKEEKKEATVEIKPKDSEYERRMK